MVGFEVVQRFSERGRELCDLGLLLFRKLEQVEVVWPVLFLDRVDLVFDAVQACHKYRGERVVWIAGAVAAAELESLLVRVFGVSRDPDDGASVGGRESDYDRRLKSRYESLE